MTPEAGKDYLAFFGGFVAIFALAGALGIGNFHMYYGAGAFTCSKEEKKP